MVWWWWRGREEAEAVVVVVNVDELATQLCMFVITQPPVVVDDALTDTI
jgi:hypothetical protein